MIKLILIFTFIFSCTKVYSAQFGGYAPKMDTNSLAKINKIMNMTGSSKFRPAFMSSYKKLGELLRDSKLEEAKGEIKILGELENLNSTEQAFYWLSNYRLSTELNDDNGVKSSLSKIVETGAGVLDSEFYAMAGMQVFRSQVESQQYGEAYNTVSHMKKDKKAKKQLKKVKSIVKKVETIVKGDEPLVQKAVVDDSGIWRRKLIRPSLYLDDVDGDVTKFGFRCENKNAAVMYEANSSLNIPKEWGACTVKVYAAEGTQFSLVQYK